MVKLAATRDASAPGRAQRFVRALVPAAVLGALAALGLAAALPAVSQRPGPVDADTVVLPQRVLSDTPFPTAQHFVTSELARTIGERNAQPGLFAPLSAHRNDMLGYANLLRSRRPSRCTACARARSSSRSPTR